VWGDGEAGEAGGAGEAGEAGEEMEVNNPITSHQSPITNFIILYTAPWKNTPLQIKIKIDNC
jgi:hypothetical protein